MSYNGWTNRETWLVNLWHGDDLDENCQGWNARGIEAHVKSFYDYDERNLEQPSSGLLKDFVAGCWGDVNWHELAGHLNGD